MLCMCTWVYGCIIDTNNHQDRENSDEKRIVKEFHSVSMLRSGSKEVLQSLDASDLARRRMSSPDNSISRQLSRSGSPDEETLVKQHMAEEEFERNVINRHQETMNESNSVMNDSYRDQDQSFSRPPGERQELTLVKNSHGEPQEVSNSSRPTNPRHSLDGSNINRVNNLFIQNAPMNDKSINRSFDGGLPQVSRSSDPPNLEGYRYSAEDDAESETDLKKRLSTASSQREERGNSHPYPVYHRQGILVWLVLHHSEGFALPINQYIHSQQLPTI